MEFFDVSKIWIGVNELTLFEESDRSVVGQNRGQNKSTKMQWCCKSRQI